MKRKTLSAGTRFAVWRRDGFCCTYCGQNAFTTDIVLEVDHVIPVSEGGTDDLANLTTACRPCNAQKGPHPKKYGSEDELPVVFSVVVTKDQAAELARLAIARGMKRAALVRLFIHEGIEKYRQVEDFASTLDHVEAKAS